MQHGLTLRNQDSPGVGQHGCVTSRMGFVSCDKLLHSLFPHILEAIFVMTLYNSTHYPGGGQGGRWERLWGRGTGSWGVNLPGL